MALFKSSGYHLTMNDNATVAVDDLSTDLTAVCASQEDNHSRNLTRLSTTTDGPRESLLRLFGHRRDDQRRPYRARSNCVDTDALADPLVAETVGESCDGALGAGVVEQVGTANIGVDAGIIDDRVALGHVWEGVLGEVEEGWKLSVSESRSIAHRYEGNLTVDVGVERLDPLLFRDIQYGILHHLESMVVEQDIDRTHILQRLVDSLLTRIRTPQISHVKVDLAAALLDHLLGEVGVFLLGFQVCDHDFCAFHGEQHSGSTADARIATRDKSFAALQLAGCLVCLRTAVVCWDLVNLWEWVHVLFETWVVLVLRSWRLPAYECNVSGLRDIQSILSYIPMSNADLGCCSDMFARTLSCFDVVSSVDRLIEA